jgi:CheY-like chemotaxis protein
MLEVLMPQPKVIIVDDDANSRAVLCDVLGGEPYTLLEAADGQRALELANKEMPDLILLDVLMPGMDGLGVLHKLKAQEETRSIPVIMVTALNLDAQVSVCLDGGAVDHICKPFSGIVVRSRVRAALRSRAFAAGDKPPAAKPGKVPGFMGVI